MKIGIILAEHQELEALKNKFSDVKENHLYDLTIYEKDNYYFVECGVGKVNAARVTQILISDFKVDCILNVGVAGGVAKEVKKCDIVIAQNLVQHDFDVTAFGREKGFIPNTGKYFNCDEYLLSIASSIKTKNPTHIGTIASGDIFVSENKMGEKINTKFNALCVEMEGAAIAQVCSLAKIPFLVIRSISDSPYEKDNNITFEEFLVISSNIIADFTLEILSKI